MTDWTKIKFNYSDYITENFTLAEHQCQSKSTCISNSNTKHYKWRNGNPPNKEQVRYTLALWMAFRKTGSQKAFKDNYALISALSQPLLGLTIMCEWDTKYLQDLFDEVKALLNDSTMLTTKTLHFLVPDLFLILDRAQVWPKWKDEFRYTHFSLLAGSIDDVDGAKYTELLSRVRARVREAINKNQGVFYKQTWKPTIQSVDTLRLVSPLITPNKLKLPNTLCKSLDNIVCNRQFEA